MKGSEGDGEPLTVVFVRHGLRHATNGPLGTAGCDLLGRVAAVVSLREAVAARTKACPKRFPGGKGRRADML